MAETTLTYSNASNGWTSFWSYVPDMMIGMNSSFFSFKDGSLYEHNTNATRNNFYGVQYNSTITTIFNQGNTETKMFKTLGLDSTNPWTATINTDLNTGTIDSSYFVDKEGDWFAYIRRADDGGYDLRAISTQGIGEATVTPIIRSVLIFSFTITTSVSIGDKVYRNNGGTLELLGEVLSYSDRTITMTNLEPVTAVTGDYIVIAKNAQAESYGARGYYMEVFLENADTTEVELFAVESSIFKSYQ